MIVKVTTAIKQSIITKCVTIITTTKAAWFMTKQWQRSTKTHETAGYWLRTVKINFKLSCKGFDLVIIICNLSGLRWKLGLYLYGKHLSVDKIRMLISKTSFLSSLCFILYQQFHFNFSVINFMLKWTSKVFWIIITNFFVYGFY